MQALCYLRYGDPEVLQFLDLPEPTPGRGEVRVQVHAASLNPKDILVRKGKFQVFTGQRFPIVPGYDLAGTVDRLGPGVRDRQLGDEVYGMIGRWAGGACGAYALLTERELARKPANLSMVDAAAMPLVCQTALQALRDLARIQPGERLLINGASGGVGTATVQIAAILGAEVTAVCSERNRDLVVSLGASEVLPYDVTPISPEHGPWDVMFDAFGNLPYERARPLLRTGGRYVTAVPSGPAIARDVASRLTGLSRRFVATIGFTPARQARLVLVKSRVRDLVTIRDWIEQGLLRPVIDRVVPVAEAQAAHEYVESKRARGKVVFTLANDL